MDRIVEPSAAFNFSAITLTRPASVGGGAYLTKLLNGGKPLYIQVPESKTRQGFVVGKKCHTDIMIDHIHEDFIEWLERLESRCQDILMDHALDWFDSSLERSDIERAFSSPLKPYKSGKFYLLRIAAQPAVKIFDEAQQPLTMADIVADTSMIAVVDVQGVRFTSSSFQLEFELKQMMTVAPYDTIFNECIIKPKRTSGNTQSLSSWAPISVEPDVAPTESAPIESDVALVEPDVALIEPDIAPIEPGTEPSVALIEPIMAPTESDIVEIEEYDISVVDVTADKMVLKKPNQVYHDKYRGLRRKAMAAKREALQAFSEAETVRRAHLLDADLSSDSGSDMD
jgi:hypothetical protein